MSDEREDVLDRDSTAWAPPFRVWTSDNHNLHPQRVFQGAIYLFGCLAIAVSDDLEFTIACVAHLDL